MKMEKARVAVVTGSNKGIGYAIVRGLCKQFDGHVYLTARNESLGKAAVEALGKEGFHPRFHQLDIEDVKSIERLAEFLKKTYGGLDVLVNNAGFAFKGSATEPFSEQAEVTMRINYFGTLKVCNGLFPLLRAHARVANVSSMMSQIALSRTSEALQQQLRACRTMEEVTKYMNDFVEAAKKGDHSAKGWPDTAYGISKVGVSLMSIIQQQEIAKDQSRPDIVINACCPGYVDTDMTSHKGTKTIDEGADTPLYLSLLPANIDEPKGKFVSDRTVKAL
jgi:carbonyl reductase 1